VYSLLGVLRRLALVSTGPADAMRWGDSSAPSREAREALRMEPRGLGEANPVDARGEGGVCHETAVSAIDV
jgi:hypothetical protein